MEQSRVFHNHPDKIQGRAIKVYVFGERITQNSMGYKLAQEFNLDSQNFSVELSSARLPYAVKDIIEADPPDIVIAPLTAVAGLVENLIGRGIAVYTDCDLELCRKWIRKFQKNVGR